MEQKANPKFYVVVNTDLRMSAGKIAAQTGHAVAHLYEGLLYGSGRPMAKTYTGELYSDDGRQTILKMEMLPIPWWAAGSPIIVLGATSAEIAALGPPDIAVTDAGRTEVAPGAQTVVAWRPTDSPPVALTKLRTCASRKSKCRAPCDRTIVFRPLANYRSP